MKKANFISRVSDESGELQIMRVTNEIGTEDLIRLCKSTFIYPGNWEYKMINVGMRVNSIVPLEVFKGNDLFTVYTYGVSEDNRIIKEIATIKPVYHNSVESRIENYLENINKKYPNADIILNVTDIDGYAVCAFVFTNNKFVVGNPVEVDERVCKTREDMHNLFTQVYPGYKSVRLEKKERFQSGDIVMLIDEFVGKNNKYTLHRNEQYMVKKDSDECVLIDSNGDEHIIDSYMINYEINCAFMFVEK